MTSVSTDFFINVIQNTPIIYDKWSKDFKKIRMKEDAWVKIAAETRMTVDSAKKRYSSLRQKYSREKRKEEVRKRSKSASIRTWVFFERLNFLNEFISPRSTYTNDIGFEETDDADDDVVDESTGFEGANEAGDDLVDESTGFEGENEDGFEGENEDGLEGPNEDDAGFEGEEEADIEVARGLKKVTKTVANRVSNEVTHNSIEQAVVLDDSLENVRESSLNNHQKSPQFFKDSEGYLRIYSDVYGEEISDELTQIQPASFWPPSHSFRTSQESSSHQNMQRLPRADISITPSVSRGTPKTKTTTLNRQNFGPHRPQDRNSLISEEPASNQEFAQPASRQSQVKIPTVPSSQEVQQPRKSASSREIRTTAIAGSSKESSKEKSIEAIRHKMDSCLTAISNKVSEKPQRSPHDTFLAYLGTKLPNVPNERIPTVERKILDLVDAHSKE